MNIAFYERELWRLWTVAYSAIKSSGVHVEKSAFGIHLRFICVSNVIGRMETTNESSGKPDFSQANDFVKWWTAALANPYPIMPGVPFNAASAPVNDNIPPGLKKRELIVAEIVDDQTLCLHIKSAFLDKSFAALPPAQPPV